MRSSAVSIMSEAAGQRALSDRIYDVQQNLLTLHQTNRGPTIRGFPLDTPASRVASRQHSGRTPRVKK